MNKTLDEAQKLVKKILDDFPPHKNWRIINYCFQENDLVLFDKYPEIPKPYYIDSSTDNNVFDLLKYHGLFDDSWENMWYECILPERLPSDRRNGLAQGYKERLRDKEADMISGFTYQLRELGEIGEYSSVRTYYRVEVEGEYDITFQDQGPEARGGFVLFFRKQLEHFLNYYSNKYPIYDRKTKTLKYLGEEVKFDGELEARTAELLITNINSLVSREEFYSVRGDEVTKYQNIKRKTQLHDTLKKQFENFEKKVKSNSNLVKALVFVIQDGYGVFINTRLPIDPHIELR